MKILITGASKGLGAAIAKNFASSGEHELFLVSRNKGSLLKLQQEFRTQFKGAEINIYPFDLEKEENIRSLISGIRKKTRYLDAIINNAGHIVNRKFSEIQRQEISRLFAVNYTAPALIIRESLDLLGNAKNAHVVNISSMGGFQGSVKFPGLSHYSASKAALAVLTECLATELKGRVSVNCLSIGSVQTEMLEKAFPGYTAALNASEMAEFVCDFTMNAHKYINGKIIPVSLSTP